MKKLAIVTTHPVQYYAPLFRALNARPEIELHVFYLWDFGVTNQQDPGFQTEVNWDLPLLSGYEHTFVPNTSSSPGTHSFWGINNPELVPRLTSYEPDAIVTFGFQYLSLYRLLFSSLQSKTPIILRGDSHNLVKRTGFREQIKRLVRKQIFARYHAFLYVGEANKQYLVESGASSSQLFFSPHTIDNERFGHSNSQASQIREQYNIPSTDFVFLFAGKFEKKKRPDALLEAFLALQDSSNAHLLLVGSGELKEQLAISAKNHPRVHFHPFANQQEMPPIYSSANVLVLPSYGPYETWGLCVNEAFACKTPAIVSSHVGCAQDLIQDHDTGRIFDANSLSSLKEAMQFCLSNPTEVERWSNNAYKRITGCYSYNHAIDGFLAALHAL